MSLLPLKLFKVWSRRHKSWLPPEPVDRFYWWLDDIKSPGRYQAAAAAFWLGSNPQEHLDAGGSSGPDDWFQRSPRRVILLKNSIRVATRSCAQLSNRVFANTWPAQQWKVSSAQYIPHFLSFIISNGSLAHFGLLSCPQMSINYPPSYYRQKPIMLITLLARPKDVHTNCKCNSL